MKNKNIFLLLSLILLSALMISQNALSQEKYEPAANTLKWYKGNTHTHSLNSDGDSFPDEVAKWYRQQGYNFLVITDHNYMTEVEILNQLYGLEGKFLIIKGDEVSDKFGEKPIHLNALNPAYNILPQGGNSVGETLQNNIDAIRQAGAVVHINHPNFHWAITAEDLKKVNDCMLVEIYSGHPVVNNLSGGGLPSVEQIWDEVLTSGKLLYGVAVDDMHDLKEPWEPKAAKPGQAWVMVRANHLTVETILESLEQGNFYASTGVVLSDYEVKNDSMKISIKEEKQTKYRVDFIGNKGKVLKEEINNPAIYVFKGNEKYVRAKIIDTNGNMSWTQPVKIK